MFSPQIEPIQSSIDFAKRENLIRLLTEKGQLKWRNHSTVSPYLLAKWELDDMVKDDLVEVKEVKEGFFRKSFLIYKLKNQSK
jgi:HD-like signal output (HDOD) protein